MQRLMLAAAAALLFAGAEAKGTKAGAKHILMKKEEDLQKVLEQINAGEVEFDEAAKEHSTCPSGKKGGDLGSFSPGSMVKEFDGVVFGDFTKLDEIYGPVETQFGFHLIKVYSRDDLNKKEKKEKKAKKDKKKKSKPNTPLKSLGDLQTLVMEPKEVVAVEFYSGMCGSCKEFAPVWDKYAKNDAPCKTAKVNIDDAGGRAIADKLGIMEEGIPNVRVFTGDSQGVSITKGDVLSKDELEGAMKKAFKGLKKGKKSGMYKKAGGADEEL
eukprot:TRINITY_DN3376_c0_g4_i1.p1 TRINITY_DN3376_c0_g4~~TRINITY_DN3376_c0_g4_i1.p1  ORF type:complete len:270 (+),score=160.35 TRINITY_DN3376_c0_g4_i1:65-874(+)